LRSLTCLNLAAAASGLGYAVITTIPNTLITMYHEEPELYYGSHSARAGVGEDIAILDSGYFLSQVLPSLPIRHLSLYENRTENKRRKWKPVLRGFLLKLEAVFLDPRSGLIDSPGRLFFRILIRILPWNQDFPSENLNCT
jgi:hypothetical protein